MNILTVNSEKCTKCGICVEVCPTNIIKIGKNGPRTIAKACIRCGHCTAVCPEEALDNEYALLRNQIPIEGELGLNSSSIYNYLRSRRSIRTYEDKSVDKEKLFQLLDIGRFAQTGTNSQNISYIVIDGTAMKEISELVVQWMEDHISKKGPWEKYFAPPVRAYRKNDIDTILRGAPQLIVSVSDKEFGMGRENSIFSLTYMEIYAKSIGLGTCWAGYFELAIKEYEPLLKFLNLPENQIVTGAIMVGYPKYKYQRLVERDPLKVVWFDEKNN